MSARIWDGASWVDAAGIRVWTGSAWAPASAGRIWNGSAWVDFLSTDGTPALTNHTLSASRTAYNDGGSTALTRLTVQSDGSLVGLGSTAWNPSFVAEGSIFIDTDRGWTDTLAGSSATVPFSGQWLVGGTPSRWSVRATITSGGVVSSGKFRTGTYGSWLDASTAPQFGINVESSTSQRSTAFSMDFTLELALTSNLSTVLASSTISMSTSAVTDPNSPP